MDLDLTHAIASLRRCYRRSSASSRRFAFYRYLARIYQVYRRLRRRGIARRTGREVAKAFKTGSAANAHPLRVLVDATSTADRKTKWRWTQGLRFVWRERHAWGHFDTFMRRHGGIAGCAREFAAMQPGPPRGFMAYGGPNRRPRVPLYISKDLIAKHGSWPPWFRRA